jgi:membrane-anchored protein YejM (alkaline phosphatase superfamily)
LYLDPPSPGAPADGNATLAQIARWLDQLQGEDGGPPFFLWVHLFDAHAPYRVPAAFATLLDARGLGLPAESIAVRDLPLLRSTPSTMIWLGDDVNSSAHLAALYRQGVAYVDHLTGELFQALESRELMQNTVFVVTADHGESLGEQGFWTTHASIYPSVQRVPLILHGPGIPHRTDTGHNVSTLDVASTLANLAGLSNQFDLHDNYNLLATGNQVGSSPNHREIWFESQTLAQIGRVQDDQLFLTNVADVNMGLRKATEAELASYPFTHYSKTYLQGELELYDMASDSALEQDLSDTKSRVAQTLDKRARARLQKGLQSRDQSVGAELTPRERERLSALGYTDL